VGRLVTPAPQYVSFPCSACPSRQRRRRGVVLPLANSRPRSPHVPFRAFLEGIWRCRYGDQPTSSVTRCIKILREARLANHVLPPEMVLLQVKTGARSGSLRIDRRESDMLGPKLMLNQTLADQNTNYEISPRRNYFKGKFGTGSGHKVSSANR